MPEEEYLYKTHDDQYLDEFIIKERKAIEGRKTVSDFLLRLACQTASSGLAIVLFQFALHVWLITLVCYIAALAPMALCLDIERLDEENWRIILMKDGVKVIVSLAIAVGFTYIRINEVYSQIHQTDRNLERFIADLRAFEHPTQPQYELPPQGAILLAAVAIVAILGWLADKKGR